jgi:hypothetical protein
MMVRALTTADAVSKIAEALGCSSDASACIKPALRRALYLLAPASRVDVIRFVIEPLAPLGVGRSEVEAALEELIVYGDALEMRKLASDPWDVPALTLRPAPPSFVERGNGSFVILGVAGDHPSALTPELQARLDESGPVRCLAEQSCEALGEHLHLLGLAPLTEASWLRTPPPEPPAAHVQRWRGKLELVPRQASAIGELEILDSDRRADYYRGRWREPDKRLTGLLLARRPQLYGAPLWSIADFEAGTCHRLIDLETSVDWQRPCDLGWRFQAAVDAAAGHPQTVCVRSGDSGMVLDFFSPLPAFAERRLVLVGKKRDGERCLFSFELPANAVAHELAALETDLWMRTVREENSA